MDLMGAFGAALTDHLIHGSLDGVGDYLGLCGTTYGMEDGRGCARSGGWGRWRRLSILRLICVGDFIEDHGYALAGLGDIVVPLPRKTE